MIRKIGAFLRSACALWILGVSCAFAGSDISYIVGLQNAEDILPIGTTHWLIASGLVSWHNDPNSRGHLYLVNSQDGSFEVLFPGEHPVFRQDQKTFPHCPGPLDTEHFSAHGLALRQTAAGRFRMYMTSHGGREAVEAFDIDARGAKPAVAWVGCVLLPEKMWSNSVAILKDGGFLVTKSKDSTNPDAFKHLVEARITGAVFEWHPGGSVKLVPGTGMSCPNGIALSADDRWMYLNAMGTRQVIRFDRKAPAEPGKAVSIPVYPDNIHWGDDGMLYTIGRNANPGPNCPWLNCGTGWSIVRVDPHTLAAERVAGVDGKATLQAPSAVITVADRFWIGAFDSDRIGYLPRSAAK
jgi:SMP-30/gluconolaconase/LRE-like protein